MEPTGSAADETLEVVRSWIREARRVAVLTGAGISTESGIPDFRGPKGVWTRNPDAEKMATLQHYVSDPEVRKRSLANLDESSGERGRMLIVDALHDTDASVCSAAAATAAKMGVQASVFSLILLLDDVVTDVRREAKTAIEHITSSVIDFDPDAVHAAIAHDELTDSRMPGSVM